MTNKSQMHFNVKHSFKSSGHTHHQFLYITQAFENDRNDIFFQIFTCSPSENQHL